MLYFSFIQWRDGWCVGVIILSVLIRPRMIFWYLWPPTGIFPLTCHSWTRKWWCGVVWWGHTGTQGPTIHVTTSALLSMTSFPLHLQPSRPALTSTLGGLIFHYKITRLRLADSLSDIIKDSFILCSNYATLSQEYKESWFCLLYFQLFLRDSSQSN